MACVVCAWVVALALPCADARADDVVAATSGSALTPRELYDRGAAAYDAGDYARALADFAKADELAPNATTLEQGLKAALRADDPVLAMVLAERARSRGATGELLALAARVREQFGSKVAEVVIRCPSVAGEQEGCDASLDGVPLEHGKPMYVLPGEHTVVLRHRGSGRSETIRTVGGERREVVVLATEPAAGRERPIVARRNPREGAPAGPVMESVRDPVSDSRRALTPVWFWTGVGLTGLTAGAAVASGADLFAKYDTYLETLTVRSEDTARAAQTRTNVLIGVTIGLAVVTAVTGVFFTEWSARASARKARPPRSAAARRATLP